jgi:pyruvate formate lyase activating enzyme
MRIGGLQKCSLIDYPGKISAIVFTVGCNFRCPYCHNPELVDETVTEMPAAEVFEFLEHRKNLLDAVTITGGEPTMHSDLIPFMQKIKDMGFLVKLDTNGTNPDVIEHVQKEHLVDYIAMDIKSPVAQYEKTVGRPVNGDVIKRSIRLLINGSIPYEFRTTVVKTLLSPEDIHSIGEDIRGAKKYVLQKFIPTKTLNPAFLRKTTYTDAEFEEMRTMVGTYVSTCIIR